MQLEMPPALSMSRGDECLLVNSAHNDLGLT